MYGLSKMLHTIVGVSVVFTPTPHTPSAEECLWKKTNEHRGLEGHRVTGSTIQLWKMANEAIMPLELDVFFVVFLSNGCVLLKKKKKKEALSSLKQCTTKEPLWKNLLQCGALQSDSRCESATVIGATSFFECWRCDTEVVSSGQRPRTPHQTEMVMSLG